MRAAGKAGYLDTGNPAWDMLCDLALHALNQSRGPLVGIADHARRLKLWYHRGTAHGLTVEQVDAVFDAVIQSGPSREVMKSAEAVLCTGEQPCPDCQRVWDFLRQSSATHSALEKPEES